MNEQPAPRRIDEQGFVRTTISVPASLKRRMDRVAANWSAVASRAFEEHLERHQSKEAPMSEEDAVQRLRRLKESGEAAARVVDPAYEVGRRWAMTDAHPGELARLDGYFVQRLEPGGPVPGDWHDRNTFKHHLRDITAAVTGVSDPAAQDVWKQFWRERSGLDPSTRPTPAAVYAFCRGAVDFWRKVKDKV